MNKKEICHVCKREKKPYHNFMKNDIDKVVRKWLDEFATKKIYGDKTIKDILAVDNYSFWWSMEYAFLAGLPCFEPLKFLFNDMRNGIFQRKKLRNRLIWVYLKRIRLIIRKVFWILLNLIFHIQKKKEKPIIFFPTRNYWYYDKHNKKLLFGDCFQPIINELDVKKNCIVSIEYPLEYNFDFVKIFKGLKAKNIRRVPFEHYINVGVIFRAIKKHIKIKKIWRKVSRNTQFKDSFIFNGKNIYTLFKKDMDFFINSYLLDSLIEFETLKHIISLENPKIVSMFGEASSFGRILCSCARKNGIKSIGIQHGMIGNYIHYVHSKEHISSNLELSPKYSPIFDKTAIYGNHYKRWLVKHANYKPEWLCVTGDPRSDIFYYISNMFNRDKLCRELGISFENKIILFTTDIPQTRDEILNIFKSFKELKNAHLIMKIHPRMTEYSMYAKIANELSIRNITIIKDMDIYQLLYICDLMVSSLSTTILEAIILKKPVIMLKRVQGADYLDFGWATRSKLILLVEDVQNIFKSIYFKADMKEYKKYISDYYYKNDGKSAKRIAKLLTVF